MKRKDHFLLLLLLALASCKAGPYEPGPQPDISGYYKGYIHGLAGVNIYIAVLNQPGGQMHYYELGPTDRDTTASGVVRHTGGWSFIGNEYEAAFTEDQLSTTLSAEMKEPYRTIVGKIKIEQTSEVDELPFTLKKQ